MGHGAKIRRESRPPLPLAPLPPCVFKGLGRVIQWGLRPLGTMRSPGDKAVRGRVNETGCGTPPHLKISAGYTEAQTNLR